ncbi:MAG: hypothetical protein ACRD4A_07325, partial [Candidatus Acidiferrales bacterium]
MKATTLKLAVMLGLAASVCGGVYAQAQQAAKPRWQMPTVTLVQDAGSQEIPREKTQLAETKTKPTSMAGLAGDSAVTQGIQAGVSDAAWSAASHMNNAVGGTAVQQGGSILGGMLGSRKPMATYV